MAGNTATKKKATKKSSESNQGASDADGPPIPVDAPPAKAERPAATDQAPTGGTPEEPEQVAVTKISPAVPVGPPVALNRRGQAVAVGEEDSNAGGKNCSQYVGNINLSTSQRIGLHRLKVGLRESGELVEMPNARGRKEVTTETDALRWLLQQLAQSA